MAAVKKETVGEIENEEEQGKKTSWVAGQKESAEEKMVAVVRVRMEAETEAAETTWAVMMMMMMMKTAEMVETIQGEKKKILTADR